MAGEANRLNKLIGKAKPAVKLEMDSLNAKAERKTPTTTMTAKTPFC